MTTAQPTKPLLYNNAIEQPEEDEEQTTQDLIENLRKINETTFKDYGHAVRSVHAKSHGLLRGKLTVLDNLPPALAQGIFAQPGSYPVVMRLSTVPGDILDDSVSTPRGLALKVLGVEGDRLNGSEGATTQDFVMVNGPAFLAPNAKAFLSSLKLLGATTDKVQGLKKAFSAVARGTEKVIEALGGESAKLISMGGHPETNILGETFYSQAPLLYGAYMAKISVAPISANLTALTDAPLNVNGKPNGLREAVIEHFRQFGGEWEVRVQFCLDLDTTPIEDSSVVWPEDKSPFYAVARITADPQIAWSEARSKAVDDGMSFSPWHGIAAHRPLGSIMRVRKTVYDQMAKFRAERNNRVMTEPTSLDDFPA